MKLPISFDAIARLFSPTPSACVSYEDAFGGATDTAGSADQAKGMFAVLPPALDREAFFKDVFGGWAF